MSKKSQFLLSVVVPCFNEEDVIQLTHKRLVEVLGSGAEYTLEIIYVNDGSVDRTEEMVFVLADLDERVKVISLTRNFGHQAAVAAGMAYAAGDVVVIIDADLQDPPEEIPKMIALWQEGLDVVYGVRTKRKEGPLLRFAYASFYRFYRLVASIDVPLDSGDFALLDRRVVDALNSLPERNRFVRGLRTWVGYRQGSHVYERATRAAGETKYPFHKLLKLAFDGIFNFSTTPLTVIFFTGASVSLLSAAAALVYIVARIGNFTIFGHTPEEARGFTTLILTILFFSGVQLISVGILGEYLGRIYQEVKMRPIYLVKETRGKWHRRRDNGFC